VFKNQKKGIKMKISKGTIIRTILIAIVIINRLLEINGKSVINVSESEIAMLLEYVLEIGIIVAGFWYNNSFTEKAK
jgi:SPP1 family holin